MSNPLSPVGYAVPVAIEQIIFKHKYNIYYKCILCWNRYFTLTKINNKWLLKFNDKEDEDGKKYKIDTTKTKEDMIKTLLKLGISDKVYFKLELINLDNNVVILKKTLYSLKSLIEFIYDTEDNLNGITFEK